MSEIETEPQTEPTEPTPPIPEPEPEPEEVEEAEQEEAPPPEPEPPSSQAEMERQLERLDKESTRHANRVSEIMGEDAQALEVCPLCWTPGFVWPATVAPISDEVRASVKSYLGEGLDLELLEAEDAEACAVCNAMGVTLTGSKVEAQRTKPCAKCNGTGWVTKFQPQPPPVLPQTVEGAPVAYAPNGGQPIAADRWGRPAGHPHYGFEPASVGA